MTFDEAAAHALALSGTEAGSSYRRPAVKANGRVVLSVGHEAATSFALHLPMPLVDMLVETHPATFWQSPHYAGYAVVLVRYAGPDAALVRETIERAVAEALASRPRRGRA